MDYIYAVARIHAKEKALLNAQDLERLLSAKQYKQAISVLQEKNWGSTEEISLEKFVAAEEKKMWDLLEELVDDMRIFDVFLYPNDYHNLKTACKQKASGNTQTDYFIDHGTIPAKTIQKAVSEDRHDLLPDPMRVALKQAQQALNDDNQVQICDLILDRASLYATIHQAKQSKDEVIRYYGEASVAMANIKTAVRACNMAKPQYFIDDILCPCDSLDIHSLSIAAAKNTQAIAEYLKHTEYYPIAPQLSKSLAWCEKCMDDMLIEKIKSQKYEIQGTSPLSAYLLAKKNEIKNVRLILLGKCNDLNEDTIRERLRIMYV